LNESRRNLEEALQLLARGSTEDDELAISLLRDRVKLDDNAIRWELHAVRFFAVETGIYLGCGSDPSKYDDMLAALYSPIIREVRDSEDNQASLDFNVLKSRVELYRGRAESVSENTNIEPKELVRHIGRQFATLCETKDPKVAAVGSGVFVETSTLAKKVSETTWH
jgi:hypothetical protein